jgi:hypothetical protein
MAFDNWNSNDTESISWAIFGIWIVTVLGLLIAYAWYTNNQEREMMLEHNLSKCLIYVPNTGQTYELWQKECQKLKLYPGVIINK